MKIGKIEILAGIIVGMFAYGWLHSNLVVFGLVKEPLFNIGTPVIFIGGWVVAGLVVYLMLSYLLGRGKETKP